MTYQFKRLATVAVASLGLLVSPIVAELKPDRAVASTLAKVAQVKGPSCGATIAKSSGGNWICTFADEFAGKSLNRLKWLPQTTSASGFHSGKECFVDSPNNIAVSGGYLNLTVRREAKPFTCASPRGNYNTQYTSGMVSTWDKFSQAYGRFEIRAKFPSAKVAGLQSALWLYPQKLTYGGWPSSGEIDIAETYSKYPDRAIPFVHYNQATNDRTVTNNYCMIRSLGSFHSYVAEWTPTTITIKYDGAICTVHEWNPAAPLVKPAPFDQPFIVILTQALGIGENAFNPSTTPLPATTQVDYVHVWS